jgi:hypothetical protein
MTVMAMIQGLTPRCQETSWTWRSVGVNGLRIEKNIHSGGAETQRKTKVKVKTGER